MSIWRAAPAAEGLKIFQDERSQEEIEAARIVRRVARSVRHDRMKWPVRGDLFNVRRTSHPTEVYAMAAARLLEEEGIEIEVHSMTEHFERNHSNWLTTTPTSSYDKDLDSVFVMSVDGEDIWHERMPRCYDNHVAQVYPPEEAPEPTQAGQEPPQTPHEQL